MTFSKVSVKCCVVFTFFSIRNLHAFAVAPLKLPSMKRALDTVSQHPSSHSQVRPQVRAVGINHMSLPSLGPKHCYLLTWPGKRSINDKDQKLNKRTIIIRSPTLIHRIMTIILKTWHNALFEFQQLHDLYFNTITACAVRLQTFALTQLDFFCDKKLLCPYVKIIKSFSCDNNVQFHYHKISKSVFSR